MTSQNQSFLLLSWTVAIFTLVSGQDVVGNVTLVASDTLFYSPGYNNSLPYTINKTSHYRFQTFYPGHKLLLTVIEFVIEPADKNMDCLYDKIVLYDGYNDSAPVMKTLCGNISAGTTYTTTGNTVYVVFYSDDTKTYKGFQMSVKSVGPTEKDVESSSLSIWIIVGCCVGVLLLLIFCGLIIYCLKREKRHVKPTKSLDENGIHAQPNDTRKTSVPQTNIFDIVLPTTEGKANLLPPISSKFSPRPTVILFGENIK